MKIVAKFTCYRVTETASGEEVAFSAVTSGGPDDPNRAWSEATPAGNCELLISNPSARGKFKAGSDYILTFEPVRTLPDVPL